MPQGLAQIRRVAVIAALCAIAAIGLQARAALPTTARGVVAGATGQAFADITAAVTGASMVAGLVLLVLVGRYRRKRKRNQSAAMPMPWWARIVSVLLALAVIVGPIVLIVRAWNGRRPVRHVLSPALGQPGRALGSNTSSGWALFAGMAFTAAALIIAALWVRRQRRGHDMAGRLARSSRRARASLRCRTRCRLAPRPCGTRPIREPRSSPATRPWKEAWPARARYRPRRTPPMRCWRARRPAG